MSNRLQIVRFAPGVVMRVINDEAVVLNLSKEQVFSLNDTGTRVAQLIGEELSTEAIVERLRNEYPEASADIASAVRDLVGALIAKGLVLTEPRDAE